MDNFILFFQQGGVFMYPIALVLAAGLAIALERYFYLSKAKYTNSKAFNDLFPLLKAQDFKGAMQASNNSNASLATMISSGISRLAKGNRQDVEYAMEECLMDTLPRLEKRTSYLQILANIATLLGLLGTIFGLIDAFSSMAQVDVAKKADMLSSSISQAMNTTAFGLISAIPLLFLHAILQSKTAEIVDSIEQAGVRFLNIIPSNS